MTALRIVAAALALAAHPASAQDVGGAWKAEGDRVALRIAKVGFPTRVAGVSLVKTGEITAKGEALDNFAQFESADRKVFATAYVYRPTYADAALAAYATDRSISARFATPVPAQQTSVPFAGQPSGAIRQVFTGTLGGDAMVTAAAFARVGGWIVKFRATGPADRAAEVTAALDALLAGATVDPDALVYPAQPLRLGAPCPAAETPAAKLVDDDKTGAAALAAVITGGSMIAPRDKVTHDPFIAFPANGATEACVRGVVTLGGDRIELLQPAGVTDPAAVLAVIGDAGTVIAVERTRPFSGYMVKRYSLGMVAIAGRVDRLPSAAQLQRWLTTPNAPEMQLTASTTVKANGSTQINIDSSRFK